MTPWTEESRGGAVVLQFAGTNADVADEIEMATFARSAKGPAKEDPGGAAHSPRAMTPRKIVALACAFVLTAIVQGILSAFHVVPAVLFGAAFVTWFGGFLAPTLVLSILESRAAKPIARSAAETFTITLDESTVAMEGSGGTRGSWARSSIETVDVDRGRLRLRFRDGGTERLAARLAAAGGMQDLAARLRGLLGV